MSFRFHFVTLEEARIVQRLLAEQFGGSPDLRDEAALELALAEAVDGHLDGTAHIAAQMIEAVLEHRPCVEGNLRFGFAIADIFLRRHGVRFNAAPDQLIARLRGFAERTDLSPGFGVMLWLKDYVDEPDDWWRR